jgi:hypothetical protein
MTRTSRRRNARVYELTHSLPVEQVLADARETFDELLKIIEALPEKYFSNRKARNGS